MRNGVGVIFDEKMKVKVVRVKKIILERMMDEVIRRIQKCENIVIGSGDMNRHVKA